MDKVKSVVDFYMLCNKLKDIIRTGWKDWGVNRERVESVAEHIYGVQMLAIAMWSEFGYNVDIRKVIMMLAVHELEETVIGDLTQFQIDAVTKKEKGEFAVKEILKKLIKGDQIKDLILEFDERKTKEAFFCYLCDKLESDIQSKIYDEENCVDLENQDKNEIANDDNVKNLLNSNMSFGEMWISYGQMKYPYDNNFLKVSNYVKNNKIIGNK